MMQIATIYIPYQNHSDLSGGGSSDIANPVI